MRRLQRAAPTVTPGPRRLGSRQVHTGTTDAAASRVESTHHPRGLPSALYPDVVVTYIHKLGKGDRCRIETVQETRTRLVCARD